MFDTVSCYAVMAWNSEICMLGLKMCPSRPSRVVDFLRKSSFMSGDCNLLELKLIMLSLYHSKASVWSFTY